MGAGEFLNAGEERRVSAVIREIESRTTGEVHVHLASSVSRQGVLADAQKLFSDMHFDRLPTRNGVLIYIAVEARQFACLGDRAIHEKLGEGEWQRIVGEMRSHFAKGSHFDGVAWAVRAVGAELARHFPLGTSKHVSAVPAEISKD